MALDVFAKTIRDYRWSILLWGLGMAIVAGFYTTFYPSMSTDPAIAEYWRNAPPVLRAFFGNVEDLATFEGFLSSELLSWFPILLAIVAILRASAALAGEEEEKTLDLLLVQPVPAWRIVVEKALAIALFVLLVALLSASGIAVAVLAFRMDVAILPVYGATLNAALVALFAAALGLVGSALFHRARHGAAIAGAYVIAAYVVNALAVVVDRMEPFRYASAFHYYLESAPLRGEWDVGAVLALAIPALLLVGASAWLFERKETRG